MSYIVSEIVNPQGVRPAVGMRLRIGEEGNMGTGTPQSPQITVDTLNETATLEFVDDRGNVTSPPTGASVTFVSSDPNIASIAADPANPFVGNITPANVGSVQLSVTTANAVTASGAPIPDPDPVLLQVNPGAAAGERLTVGAGTPTTGTPTTAPAAQATQPVYTYAGTTADTTVWPESGFQTTEEPPRLLYYYTGDVANSGQTGTANGNGADGGLWQVYTGPVQPVSAP